MDDMKDKIAAIFPHCQAAVVPLAAARIRGDISAMKRTKPTATNPIVARIDEARAAKGWSRQKVSTEAGLDRGFLGKLESRGARASTLTSNIARLATAVGIDVKDLLAVARPDDREVDDPINGRFEAVAPESPASDIAALGRSRIPAHLAELLVRFAEAFAREMGPDTLRKALAKDGEVRYLATNFLPWFEARLDDPFLLPKLGMSVHNKSAPHKDQKQDKPGTDQQ